MAVGAWLSLVERCVRDAEAGGSNPLAPTRKEASFVYVNKRGFFSMCYKHTRLNTGNTR